MENNSKYFCPSQKTWTLIILSFFFSFITLLFFIFQKNLTFEKKLIKIFFLNIWGWKQRFYNIFKYHWNNLKQNTFSSVLHWNYYNVNVWTRYNKTTFSFFPNIKWWLKNILMLIAHPVGTKTQFFPNHPKPRRPGKVNEIASSSGASLSRRLVVALSNQVHA